MSNAVKRVQEKIVPIHCVCGSAPVLVKKRGGTDVQLPESGTMLRQLPDYVAAGRTVSSAGMEHSDKEFPD